MGSLITLLAVADILGNNTAAMATYSKRLVLTALMGEPWGFMGSKRLLWEMHNDADTTGVTLDIIEQVWSTARCHPDCKETETKSLRLSAIITGAFRGSSPEPAGMLLYLWILTPVTLFLHYAS